MAFWWVNHKQTREQEVRGGYLWSPIRNSNGSFNQTYDNMRLVRAGDIVFSYAGGQIGAIGYVVEPAAVTPKPTEFGTVGTYWAHEGWLVGVHFTPAPVPLVPKAHAESIAPLLPKKHSPIRANGHGNQNAYLAAISDLLGNLLLTLLEAKPEAPFATKYFVNEPEIGVDVLDDIHAVENDTSIPETQRLQLAKARVGQGLFRKRVMLVDPHCRVTGVTAPHLLIASHIKSWRHSTNAERIDGFNGIMLSPHVDALFDDHLLSFDDDGRMLLHSNLPADVLERWSIPRELNVGKFQNEQTHYLEHHRRLFSAK